MTIQIDFDREENKIELLMASQTEMIRTLKACSTLPSKTKRCCKKVSLLKRPVFFAVKE